MKSAEERKWLVVFCSARYCRTFLEVHYAVHLMCLSVITVQHEQSCNSHKVYQPSSATATGQSFEVSE